MTDNHRPLCCEFLEILCVNVRSYSWPFTRCQLLISGSQVRALHGSSLFQSFAKRRPNGRRFRFVDSPALSVKNSAAVSI
jgi:hypothetical protein